MRWLVLNKLRKQISLFFYRNRDKGIHNLMLYIAIGNVIVYLISLIDKIPTDGESFTVEALGYDFEVLSVEDKMIRQVLVKKSAKKSDAEQTDACNENE